ILRSILPDLQPDADWLGRIDRAVPRVRLAALFAPLARSDVPHLDRAVVKRVLAIARALKLSNVECDLAAQLVGAVHASRIESWTAAGVRRLLCELDRDKRVQAIELWAAESAPNAMLIALARDVLVQGHALSVGELAISGNDLMTALDMEPGP